MFLAMKKPTIPDNERERLQALIEYRILDTQADPFFDDLTELASLITGCPIALVSLTDEHRQWFKSKKGLLAHSSPREISFCGHAINEPDIFVVKDASMDERFFDNPYVTAHEGIRFYAGVPLVDQEGHALGTLCVIDKHSRELTSEQIKFLKIIAHQVLRLMELHKAKIELTENFKELQELARLNSEQQDLMIQSSRLACLGQMAAALSHEINNPLAIINLVTDKSQRTHQFDERSASIIRENITRISSILDSLRNFSNTKPTHEKKYIGMESLINELTSLFSERLRAEDIKLQYQNHADVSVLANETELRHIIMNVLLNSIEAVKKSLMRWIQIKTFFLDGNFCIEISDSGPGINKNILPVMMEPFTTTKDVGEGQGLGLSVCLGLAVANGVKFEHVKNAPHTTFRLSFPTEIVMQKPFQEHDQV
jgi:signal transduction histidine kinase